MSELNRRRRTWLWGAGLIVVALLAAGGWWLAARSTGAPLPPPRWTLADLPAPPPPAENGWARLRAGGPVRELSAEVGALVPPGGELDPSDDLALLVEAGAEAELKSDAALRREVARLARFADDTEPFQAATSQDPTLSAVALWRQRALAALLRAEQGQMDEALVDAERMWRQAHDLAGTCRGQVSCRGALGMLATSLDTIAILAGQTGPEHRERLAAAARLLDDTDLKSLTLRQVLVAQQLARRAFNRSRDQQTRHALAAFADFTEAAIAYAEDAARPEPSFPPDAIGYDWWPFDDEEAQALQGVADLTTTMIDNHRAERDELIRSRDRLVAQLLAVPEGAGGAAGDE